MQEPGRFRRCQAMEFQDRTPKCVDCGSDFVFTAGDCASLEAAPRPKAGVWAIRAGRPLATNLRRRARHQRMRCSQPQRDSLVILGLGNQRAVAWRNGLTVSGRWVWTLKDRIDRNWTASWMRRIFAS